MEKYSLLIVDDEQDLAESVGMIFSHKGIDVILAYNAMEGLKKIKERPFDCVISDISMPGMTGLQLLKEVRNLGIDTPFIIYTGYGNEESILEASKLGCFEFIDKPEMEGLENAVERAVKMGRELHEGKFHGSINAEDMAEINEIIKKIKSED